MSARARQRSGSHVGSVRSVVPGRDRAGRCAGAGRETPTTRVPAPGRALTSPSSASRW